MVITIVYSLHFWTLHPGCEFAVHDPELLSAISTCLPVLFCTSAAEGMNQSLMQMTKISVR